MNSILTLILTGTVLAVVNGQQMCPSGAGTIQATCEFGCACGCGDNPATFTACVSACVLRIGGPLGCDALAIGGDAPNEQCANTHYDKNAACARVCACCGIPTAHCSCQNAVGAAVFGTACSLS